MPSNKIITLSFDDGTNADRGVMERIRAVKGTATFYLCSHWISEAIYPGVFWPEISKLYDGFEVGGHTQTHWKFCKIKEDPAEIAAGKEEVEAIIKKPLKCFAYPYGYVHDKDAVRAAGFEFARTVKQTFDIRADAGDPYEQPTSSTLNINFATNIIQTFFEREQPIHLLGHSWQYLVAGYNTLDVLLKRMEGSGYTYLTNYEFFKETCRP